MDFAYDSRTEELRKQLLDFMDARVYPAEAVFAEQVARNAQAGDRWRRPAVVAELKQQARSRGLWNLFLTHNDSGPGLTNLQYAPLAEITGRSPWLAPEALNCAAPDTGNMELLAEFGTEEQRDRWLRPLLDGEIRSAFCMTEPDVASSDASNIATRIERAGAEYVINGLKWWSSGAMNPECEILIVMGRTAQDGDRHRQQSMILVPRDTPGVSVRRGITLFGYDDAPHGGHAEVEFRDARVPAANLIAGEGDGFAIAQARLGPGRIHHCMRLIGASERALELMCRRVTERTAFGKPLAEQGVIQGWIAEARVRHRAGAAAGAQDRVDDGHRRQQGRAHRDPGHQDRYSGDGRVGDRQGDPGARRGRRQPGLPARRLWANARTLRFADGPDEVHKRSLARRELRPYQRYSRQNQE